MIPAGVKGKGFLERTSTPLRERYIGNAHVFVGSQVDLVARGAGSPAASAYAVTTVVNSFMFTNVVPDGGAATPEHVPSGARSPTAVLSAGLLLGSCGLPPDAYRYA